MLGLVAEDRQPIHELYPLTLSQLPPDVGRYIIVKINHHLAVSKINTTKQCRQIRGFIGIGNRRCINDNVCRDGLIGKGGQKTRFATARVCNNLLGLRQLPAGNHQGRHAKPVQNKNRRPGRTPGTHHQSRLTGRRLDPRGPKSIHKTESIGIVALVVSTMTDNGIDRADNFCPFRKSKKMGYNLHLVGNANVGTGDI